MRNFPSVAFICLLGLLTGCASSYGVAEIRYTDYRYSSGDVLEDARAHPAERTLLVEGRVVDEFCDAIEPPADENEWVKAPDSVVGAVMVIPERGNSDSGKILILYPGGIDFIGIFLRDGDWKLIGTDFRWTARLVKAWVRLLDHAREAAE
jgi:hypothetical protein